MFIRQLLTLTALPLIVLGSGCAADSEKQRQPKPGKIVSEPCIYRASTQEIPEAPSQTTAPEILGVGCIDGRLAVYFSGYKEGKPLTLKAGDVSFALAKLVPGAADPALGSWVSYINRIETPVTGEWPGTEPKLQATTENTGTLTELSAGTYAYAFTADIQSVTSPTEVKFEPKLTHRVGIEFRGSALDPELGNPTYTWQPAATTSTKLPLTRTIVATESCNSCHGGLEAHGGARTDTEYCVLCHNPGSTDANSSHTVDFPVLVHKIHMGEKLPSVVAGGHYTIWGFRDTKHDYSEVLYPQDQRTCRKCHSGENPKTPDGDFWQTKPGIAACTACHDDLNITSAATTHAGGQQTDDKACASCHGPGQASSVATKHMTDFITPHNPNIADDLPYVNYALSSVTMTTARQPIVKFSIFADGMPLNLKSPPAWLVKTGTGTGVPRITIAHAITEGTNFTPADWNNTGNGQNYGQPARYNFTTAFINGLTANPDGSFTTTPGQLGTVTTGATMVAATIESYLRVDRNNNATYDSGTDAQIGGDSVIRGVGVEGTPRRQIADINKCNNCHERLALHGGNRVNNLDVCVTCHNPNATDVGQRLAPFPDGLNERSIAFSYLVHGIHMGEKLSSDSILWYGNGNSKHDYKHVKFPNKIQNCETCHFPGTYELPVEENALSVTVRTWDRSLTGVTATTAKQTAVDDWNIGPTGAACTGCHDSSSTKAHAMASSFFYTANLHGTENDSCATCHGPGESYDVRTVHGLPQEATAGAPFFPELRRR